MKPLLDSRLFPGAVYTMLPYYFCASPQPQPPAYNSLSRNPHNPDSPRYGTRNST